MASVYQSDFYKPFVRTSDTHFIVRLDVLVVASDGESADILTITNGNVLVAADRRRSVHFLD